MKNSPLVSIITPTYNARSYVKEAIDSALAQTHRNIEIIVVDDGSTDNTKEIVVPYVEKKQIKYIYQKNGGISAARNAGIKKAKGEYIALLDADDVFLPEKIKKQVTHLESNPSCDVSYCDLHHFWDDKPDDLMKLNYKYYSGREVFQNTLRRSFIAPVTVLFRKKVFEKYGYFDEAIRKYAEDFEFWLRLTYRGAHICFLPETLAKLRLRREGNVQAFTTQPEMKLAALKVVENLWKEMGAKDRLCYNMKFYLMIYRLKTAFAHAMSGKKTEASRFFSKAFQDYPLGNFVAVLFGGIFFLIPSVIIKSAARWFYYRRRRRMLKVKV